MHGSHEYQSNEDLKETHRYAIVGVCNWYNHYDKHQFKLQGRLCIRDVLQGNPIICHGLFWWKKMSS